jgi:hypothetical protein
MKNKNLKKINRIASKYLKSQPDLLEGLGDYRNPERIYDIIPEGDSNENIIGTGKVGEITASYEELHKVLGQPSRGPDSSVGDRKVTCIWVLVFSDSEVATIYEYKNSVNGITPRNKIIWSIGGKKRDTINRIRNIFPKFSIHS